MVEGVGMCIKDKAMLRKSRPHLVESMIINEVFLSIMIQKGVLKTYDYEDIKVMGLNELSYIISEPFTMEKQSYAHGPGGCALSFQTIPSLLEQRATETPNKPAHVFRFQLPEDEGNSITGRTVLTFSQLAEHSMNVACAFHDMGIRCGDKVAMMGFNSKEWLFVEYACLRLGALLIKVPSNFSTADEFSKILRQTSSKLLVVDQKCSFKILVSAFPKISERANGLDEYGLGLISTILLLKNSESVPAYESIAELAEHSPSEMTIKSVRDIEASLDADDPAIIFQTSGSTGVSKSVLYSHFRYNNTIKHTLRMIFGDRCDDANEIVFNDRPFAWIGAGCFAPTIVGLTLVHLDPAVTLKGDSVTSLFKMFAEENITSATLLQYLLFDAMQANENGTLVIPPSFKTVLTGGERIPQNILHFASSSFEAVSILYGGTECLATSKAKSEVSDGQISFDWYFLSSHTEMKLVDDGGHVVPRGEIGKVYVRGPCTMDHYLIDGMEGKLPSGWIGLGDLAVMREDGCFQIIGRTADVISRGSVKVHPKTLENILYSHDKVDKALVVGVPDPRLYEEVCAVIIPKPNVSLTEAELGEFFIEKTQANETSFAPKYYYILDQFPKAITGKTDRKYITKLAAEHFKLGK